MNTFLPCTLLDIRDHLYAYSEEAISYTNVEWVVHLDNKSILQLTNTPIKLFKENKPRLRKIVATSNRSLGVDLLPVNFKPKSSRVNIACEKVVSSNSDKVKEVKILVDKPIKGPNKGKSFVHVKDRALLTMSEAKELARKIHGSIGEFEELWSIISTRF